MENPANHPEMDFIWECDGNSFEEKNVLEDSLPEGYQYKINKFKIIEKSDIKEEIKFQAEVCVNICDKEEALRFIKSISTKNDTDMRPSRKEMMRKGFESQRYNCSRKIKRTNESQQTVPDKGCMSSQKWMLFWKKSKWPLTPSPHFWNSSLRFFAKIHKYALTYEI